MQCHSMRGEASFHNAFRIRLMHSNWGPAEGEECWEVETSHGEEMDTISTFVCSLVFSVAHATAFSSSCSPGVVDRVDTRPRHFVTAMQPKVHVLDFVLYFLDLAVQQFNWFLVVSLRALDITHFDRKKISKQWIEKERTRLWIKVRLLILKMHFLRILDCIMWGVNFCFFRIFKTQMILFHIHPL